MCYPYFIFNSGIMLAMYAIGFKLPLHYRSVRPLHGIMFADFKSVSIVFFRKSLNRA